MENTRNNRLSALSEARIEYLPSPTDIARQCASIRQGWSASERRRRRVGGAFDDEGVEPWYPPVIDTGVLAVRWFPGDGSR